MKLPFDEREGIIYYNGKYLDWRDAKVHVLNHGLHYGSSCFEGLRIYNGKIFKNLEHAERLCASASLLDFKNFKMKPEEIAEICVEVCRKNNILNGYIRPIAFRGSEEMQVGTLNTSIHFVVAAWQWPNYPEEKKTSGVHFVVAKYKRPPADSGPVFAKVGGFYVSSTLVKNEATEQGFDDALMLDFRDFIAESSASNVFFVKENEIHTPIADCFLNGITRQTIIKLAKDSGFKVLEKHIKLEDLPLYEDAFTTGSAAEICKIASITTRNLETKFEFKQSKVSNFLLAEYKKLVQM